MYLYWGSRIELDFININKIIIDLKPKLHDINHTIFKYVPSHADRPRLHDVYERSILASDKPRGTDINCSFDFSTLCQSSLILENRARRRVVNTVITYLWNPSVLSPFSFSQGNVLLSPTCHFSLLCCNFVKIDGFLIAHLKFDNWYC